MDGNEIVDRLMTVDELAQYLGLAVGTIRNKVSSGTIPYVKIGAAVRFRRSAIDAWIEEQNADPEAAEEADQVEAEEVA